MTKLRNKPIAIVVDDEEACRKDAEEILKSHGFKAVLCSSFTKACTLLDEKDFDAYVFDLNLHGDDQKSGIQLFEMASKKQYKAPIAFISGYFEPNWSTKVLQSFRDRMKPHFFMVDKLEIRHGEFDDWCKDAYDAFQKKQSEKSQAYHSVDVRVKNIVSNIVPLVASSNLPVMILGETGTGKEDLARLIHTNSSNVNRESSFNAVNCAAISETLILSELFGHTYGSFTGAERHVIGRFLEASGWKQNKGKFNKSNPPDYLEWFKKVKENKFIYLIRCDKSDMDSIEIMGRHYKESDEKSADFVYANNGMEGTLFLDEIGDLPPSAEVVLLRVLDGYGLRPVGYTGPDILPNCRIIAATNRLQNHEDLHNPRSSYSKTKTMRKDLFYRLEGWVLELPPLRDRKDEKGNFEWVESLKKWAAEKDMSFNKEGLKQYVKERTERKTGKLWDGNWRELHHVFQRAKISAEQRIDNRVITKSDLDFASQWVLVENQPEFFEPVVKTTGDRWSFDDFIGHDGIITDGADKSIEILKLLFDALKEGKTLTLGIIAEKIDDSKDNTSSYLSALRKKTLDREESGWEITKGTKIHLKPRKK